MSLNNASRLMIGLTMMLSVLVGILITNVTAQTSDSVAPAAEPALDLYYIGNRQSAIEPCGCRTKEQGGVELEAFLYTTHKSEDPGLRLDVGDWSTPYVDASPLNSFKSRYLLRALAMMDYSAVNVGVSDLELGKRWFDDMKRKFPDATALLVSANIYLTDQPQTRAFAPWRILKRKLADGRTIRIGVTGISTTRSFLASRKEEPVDPDDPRGPLKTVVDGYDVLSAVDCLDDVVAELRPKVDLMILLSAGSLDFSNSIANQFPEFDVIITDGRPKDIDVPILDQDGVLILKTVDTLGKIVSFIRMRPEPDGRWAPVASPEQLLVSLDLPAEKKVGALMRSFKDQTEKNITLPKAGVDRIYAGAQRCMTCHPDQHRQWRKTRHEHALATLVAEGEHFNPDCLRCHTLGFQHSNGFYSVTHSPSLLMDGVQCESCHGPAAEHANTQERLRSGARHSMSTDEFEAFQANAAELIPPKTVPQAVCITCHDDDNDPHFDYEFDLPQITH